MATITDETARAIALGATGYLTKPIDRERLITLLRPYQRAPGGRACWWSKTIRCSASGFAAWLEPEHWLASEAENGRVALDRLATDTPDIILLDLMMPEMDGFSSSPRCRQSRSGSDIPVIVITALDLTAADRARLNSASRKSC